MGLCVRTWGRFELQAAHESSASIGTGTTPVLIRQHRAVAIALLAALLALPVLVTTVPPLADLPAHLARYYIGSAAGGRALAGYFAHSWHINGNLGVDAIVYILGGVLGVDIATKSVVASIPLLIGLGILFVAREIHGKIPVTLPFALPLALGWPFQMGFVNYWLSVALALLAFGTWVRLGKSPFRHRDRSALFVALACLVWAAHAGGWALLVLLCAVHEFLSQRQQPTMRRILPTVRNCLPLAGPIILMLIWRGGGRGLAIGEWLSFSTKLQWFVGALRDRWIVYDLFSLGLVIACITLPLLRPRSMRYSPTLFIAGLLLMLIAATGPEEVFRSMFAASRYFAVAFMLLAMSVTETRQMPWSWQRLLALASVSFCLSRIAAGAASFELYEQSFQREMGLLNAIPPHAAVAAFVGQPCGGSVRNWAKERLEHLPSLAIIRRDAFVNNQFAIEGSQNLKVTYAAAAPFTDEGSSHVSNNRMPCPGGFPPALPTLLAKLPMNAFDYVWIIDVPPEMWPQDHRLRLSASTNRSALFSIEKSRSEDVLPRI